MATRSLDLEPLTSFHAFQEVRHASLMITHQFCRTSLASLNYQAIELLKLHRHHVYLPAPYHTVSFRRAERPPSQSLSHIRRKHQLIEFPFQISWDKAT